MLEGNKASGRATGNPEGVSSEAKLRTEKGSLGDETVRSVLHEEEF